MAVIIGGGAGNAISINSTVGSSGQVIVSDGTDAFWGSASASSFTAGTLMLFQQTTAPTGWTKQTTHNNKALRVVSGAASSGGTTAFTSVFTSRTPTGTVGVTVDAMTLVESQIPSHVHQVPALATADGGGANRGINPNLGVTRSSSATGGNGAHSHTGSGSFTGTALDFAVQYVDLIIASKD